MFPLLEIGNDLVKVLNPLDNLRTLFNHGLLPSELYTNTPKKIVDKKWVWFLKQYGTSHSYEEAISDPFKYCLGVIINKIIEDKVRFIIPNVSESYIDFEIVSDEKFMVQRQNGRFRAIDFVESDFTGYAIRYYFKSKAYQKSYQIHLGGELKKLFLDKVNSGEKFYSIKDITINDIIMEVHDKFNSFTLIELKKLLVHGFRRMHSAIKFGCAITIATTKFINCYLYIGDISTLPDKQLREYSRRRDRKLRKIEGWKKSDFDGYYYIGLNETALYSWLEDNKKTRTSPLFRKGIARKIQKELYYKYRHLYIFRIEVDSFKGWTFMVNNGKFKGTTYIGEVNNLKFEPNEMKIKDFKKQAWKRIQSIHSLKD